MSIAKNVGKFDETALFRGSDANVSELFSHSLSGFEVVCIDSGSFDRFSRRNSRLISGMCLALWIVSVVINADSGARSKRRV